MEQRTGNIDTRTFGASEALLLVARSMAGVIQGHVVEQGLHPREGSEIGQNLTAKILARLKDDLGHRNPHERKVAIYYQTAGGHTHLKVFSGHGHGSRGKAGDLAVRNEEWQVIEFALRIFEVICPGVFELYNEDEETVEEPETVPLTIDLSQLDVERLRVVSDNAQDCTDTEEKAALTMIRWGLHAYDRNAKELADGVAELETFMKGE